jgi:hypothetical protein
MHEAPIFEVTGDILSRILVVPDDYLDSSFYIFPAPKHKFVKAVPFLSDTEAQDFIDANNQRWFNEAW